MTINLRGHHLLCLLGYRGKGYSDGFCANMTAIYERLRNEPDTGLSLIDGPDDICAAFPSNEQISHCENRSVYAKDALILERMGLAVGKTLSWAEACERAAANVAPGDIATLCRDCIWQPLGVCAEGVAHIRADRRLRELPR